MQEFKQQLQQALAAADTSNVNALYQAVANCAMQAAAPAWQQQRRQTGKRAAYFSAEFLIGRMIYSNLYNLGLLEEYKQVMQQAGLDANRFEEVEDAALGNGGLGRLAACFLDSAASRGLPLDGYGIRYRYGLFKQYFEDGFQRETADDWMRFGDPFSQRCESQRQLIRFGDMAVWAVPYDMPVIGFEGKTVNTLRLWQAEPLNAFDFNTFNSGNFTAAFDATAGAVAISSVLYPNDETDAGKRLRLKQQYFFSAASLRDILARFQQQNGSNWQQLPGFIAIQLNDTHPTIAIPELMRILIGEHGVPDAEALQITTATFAYTNHTIMAEALESWDTGLFAAVLPDVYPYVVILQNHLRDTLAAKGFDEAARAKYNIVSNGRVHMARMAIFATHSTNGVARLHTEILKNEALHEWYEIWPERFSNKTNGITQRRWLGLCNPELADFITQRIGNGWLHDLNQLQKLRAYQDDTASLQQLVAIKQRKKQQLSGHVRVHEYGFELPINAVYDVQIKRLHEYKRQLLNALGLLDIYFRLKEGQLPDFAPMVVLFGAKAAPGYYRAKGIIKFINEIARMVNNDASLNGKLKVLFVQNYNVSYAEKLIPAADISEQISTAGTEASGTGNMKFMMNGACTLGTYDGANVEIVEAAGEENNYIFGARIEDIARIKNTYNPRDIYNHNLRLRRCVDTLIDGTFSDGNTGMFRELYTSLLDGASWHNADNYYLFLDFDSYVEARLHANRDWQHPENYARRCLLNIASSGRFSSDRTIQEYADEIWHIG